MWTTKKLTMAALFAGLSLIFYLVIATPLIAIGGLGMGTIIMPIIITFFFILFKQILPDFGLTTLLGLILSILSLPLPMCGPSGFIPKVLMLPIGCFVLELVYSMLSKKPKIASTVAGIVGGETLFVLLLTFFIMLGFPAAERFISLAIPFAIFTAIECAIGGFCGYLVYQKIKNKPFIKQIQS